MAMVDELITIGALKGDAQTQAFAKLAQVYQKFHISTYASHPQYKAAKEVYDLMVRKMTAKLF